VNKKEKNNCRQIKNVQMQNMTIM